LRSAGSGSPGPSKSRIGPFRRCDACGLGAHDRRDGHRREFIAVPFGLANAALVAAWPRLRTGWQAAISIAFGLFWGLAVTPYHVLPLLGGDVTGQHISGLSRVVAGAAMVGLGIVIAARRRRGQPPPSELP
jgi:hypothetical protein